MSNYNISTDGFDPDPVSPQPQRQRQRKDADPVRRRSAKDKKTVSQPGAMMRFLRDKRTHMFIGILLLLVAVYMLIVSISFFSTSEADQSKVLHHTVNELAGEPGAVENAGGPFGAYLSHLLLTEWLGLGSFFLIFYVGAIGVMLVRLHRFRFWMLTFKCLILAVTTSIVVGLLTFSSGGHIFWGGHHGYYVNDFLIRTASVWGAIGVSLLLVALIVLIYLTQLTMLLVAWRRKVAARREAARRKAEQREAERRKVEESMHGSVLDAEEPADADSREASGDTVVGFGSETTPDEEDVEVPASSQQAALLDDIDNPLEKSEPDDDDATTAESDAYERRESTKAEAEPDLIIDGDDVNMSVTRLEIEQAKEIRRDVYDPTAELSRFRFPSIELLHDRESKENSVDQQEQEENKERITKTLADYGIAISKIKATVGPTVTLYEIIPAEGVRIAKIKRLEDDIALSLAALGIRIIAPIPGKGTIGIEVPNKEPQVVSMRSIIASKKYQENRYDLPMAMGSTISNEVFIADLAKMPHLLVAGSTGMGKSVGLNAIIASLLYKKHPAELKFVLIDPKRVEFSLYSALENHYLAKLPNEEDAIITDTAKVVTTLNSLCVEMENRYNLLRDANVRSIKEYNAKFVARRLNPEKGHRYLPYIVVIVDEFADLIMTAGKDVEKPIARIAQMARAVGMHMIIATQRPSTNVITGVIKANFPGRIAFRVIQMVDSKTILDRSGANQLIGRGDMLFSRDGELDRVQCAFIDTDEVEAICNAIAEQPGYKCAYELPEFIPDGSEASMSSVSDRDPLFEEAARFIVTSGTASTSSLQRRYSIGYNRAGKIMDQMEAAGIVGPSQGGKPREVRVDSLTLERIIESM